MKIKLGFAIIFAALFMLAGGVQKSFAQDGQIVGGYGTADVKDKDVIKAAKFAVKKDGQNEKAAVTLVAINKAQMQVVAGINYELCLQVSVKKTGKKAVKQFVKTVIYRDLKNTYSLTSWTKQKTAKCD